MSRAKRGMSLEKTMCRQTLGTCRETVPFSCFRFPPSSSHPRLKIKAGTRYQPGTAPQPETRRSSGIRECRQRLLPPPELTLSHQSVRVSVAIDDHHRHEPFAVQSPEDPNPIRSEEHTSELQSLMRISYAVFCLTKKNHK